MRTTVTIVNVNIYGPMIPLKSYSIEQCLPNGKVILVARERAMSARGAIKAASLPPGKYIVEPA
jgi:hypothetical protein